MKLTLPIPVSPALYLRLAKLAQQERKPLEALAPLILARHVRHKTGKTTPEVRRSR